MNAVVGRAAVAALLIFAAACEESGPTSPTGSRLRQPSPPPPAPAPTPPPSKFPPLEGPSRTFTFDHQLSYPVQHYTKNSRFVLYDNGAFVLKYEDIGGEYRGGYTEVDGVISFAWEGWSAAGPWGATGTLTGDSLTVQYNLIMMLTDFEDAVYVLTR